MRMIGAHMERVNDLADSVRYQHQLAELKKQSYFMEKNNALNKTL